LAFATVVIFEVAPVAPVVPVAPVAPVVPVTPEDVTPEDVTPEDVAPEDVPEDFALDNDDTAFVIADTIGVAVNACRNAE
jgi:hypothetical protein